MKFNFSGKVFLKHQNKPYVNLHESSPLQSSDTLETFFPSKNPQTTAALRDIRLPCSVFFSRELCKETSLFESNFGFIIYKFKPVHDRLVNLSRTQMPHLSEEDYNCNCLMWWWRQHWIIPEYSFWRMEERALKLSCSYYGVDCYYYTSREKRFKGKYPWSIILMPYLKGRAWILLWGNKGWSERRPK